MNKMNKSSKSKGKKTTKTSAKDKEKAKKAQIDSKNKQKEKDYQRLEEYLNESGLSLAFNIIFAELISKQILPENFFTYTAMRLTQIGKEIEGLKTKESIYVDEEEQKMDIQNNEQPEEGIQIPEEGNKEEVFMTRPQQVQSQGTQSQKNQKKKK